MRRRRAKVWKAGVGERNFATSQFELNCCFYNVASILQTKGLIHTWIINGKHEGTEMITYDGIACNFPLSCNLVYYCFWMNFFEY